MVALPSRRSVVYAAVREQATGLSVREAGEADAPKPRLLDRVGAARRARHYSRRTEDAYVAWITRYIVFHGKRHPAAMGASEVTRFLPALAVDGHVAASTQNQALSALLLLYRDVLAVDLPWLDDAVRAKRPARLPVVLTRDEVRALLQRLDGVPRLMACLLYGAGLRVLECCRLRVQDIDFATNQIVGGGGKGDKDRVTMLAAAPRRLFPPGRTGPAKRSRLNRKGSSSRRWASPRSGCAAELRTSCRITQTSVSGGRIRVRPTRSERGNARMSMTFASAGYDG